MPHKRKRHRGTRPPSRAKADAINGKGGVCPFCGDPLDFSRLAGVRGALATGQSVSGRTGGMVYVDLCGVPVAAIAAAPDSEIAREGFEVLFLLCSDDCAKAVCLASALDHILSGREPGGTANAVYGLRLTEREAGIGPQFEKAMDLLLPMLAETAPAAAERFNATLGPDLIDSPPRDSALMPTPQELEWAQRVMGERCAWCVRAIPDDAPVTALYVNLQGNDPAVREGGIVTIMIAGRRIPMHIPVPGSQASTIADAAFMVCGPACASALTAAINEDRRLSIIH